MLYDVCACRGLVIIVSEMKRKRKTNRPVGATTLCSVRAQVYVGVGVHAEYL